MSWGSFLSWIEIHPGLASWVQAIGSILAIVAAVWIASSQRREQLKNDQRKFNSECAFVKVISARALKAAKPDPSQMSVRDAARMLAGVCSIFQSVDLMKLPDASLIEPISTICDALLASEMALAKETKIDTYFGSREHEERYQKIYVAHNQILLNLAGIS